jgi:hypothetical protein
MRQLRGIGFALILVSVAAPAFAIGGFGVTNIPAVYLDGTSFPLLANVANVKLLVGDFNGDHRTDMALIGGSSWGSVPVAFSGGDGSFGLTNQANSEFAGYAATPGARPLVGDFNGDGRADIALIGPSQWGFVPMALSNGDGTFTPTHVPNPVTVYSSNIYSPKALVGDFDGDGKDDIAFIGPSTSTWSYIVMAYSDGGGNFSTPPYIVNTPMPNNVGNWASLPNAQPLVGDFNHDGIKDFALLGPSGWGSLPVTFGTSTRGTLNITNMPIGPGPSASYNFAVWASLPNAKLLVGDFNGDGKDDVSITGPSGWGSVPVAFSNGDGSFNVTNLGNPASLNFAYWAADPATRVLVGDFNGDGKADIALTGPSDWKSVLMVFSHGDGTFVLANQPIVDFGGLASLGVPIVGDFNYDHKADILLMGSSTWVSLPVAFSLTPDVTP